MKEKKNGWTLFLLILAGIVLGFWPDHQDYHCRHLWNRTCDSDLSLDIERKKEDTR